MADLSSQWQKEKLYFSAHDFFDDVIEQIHQSQKSIDIEMYILESGQICQRIKHALEQALSRGVSVRIMVDGFGSLRWINNEMVSWLQLGLQVRVYHPLPWPFTFFMLNDLLKPFLFYRLLWRVNRRDHRKLIIIDQKQVFSGGINISDQELKWNDSGVYLLGTTCELLQAEFNRQWHNAYPHSKRTSRSSRPRTPTSPLVLFNHSRTGRKMLKKSYYQHLNNCRERVWLMTAYFIPTLRTLQILKNCSRRGVDLRLVVSSHSDYKLISWIHRLSLRYILRLGGKVHLIPGPFLHSKASLIDNHLIIGSSNMNYRSSLRDLEVDFLLTHETSINAIERQFDKLTQASQPTTIESLKEQSFLKTLIARWALLFKPWM